jgi:phospholipid/cholesterol/gamma-HCH transport system substrate-binding protein
VKLLAVIALIGASVAVLLVARGGGESHEFSVVVPAASSLVAGNKINAGGHDIGKITSVDPVDGGRKARLGLTIHEDAYWPLPADSRLEVRVGGTVSFSNRYLLLERGDASDGVVADGGELSPANVRIPVELDELLNEFTPAFRRDIRGVIHNSAAVLERASVDVHSALGRTPRTLDAATGLLGDLVKNRDDLATLVSSSGEVVDAIHTADPDLRTLLDGASATFTAVGTHAENLKIALDRFPDALDQTDVTLAKANGTLGRIGGLAQDLRPGLAELKTTTEPLHTTLTSLRRTAPLALSALRASPNLQPVGGLFRRLQRLSPTLEGIGGKTAKAVRCIRPYSPELVAFGMNWGDFISTVDDRDHIVRATVQNYLPASYNSASYTAGQAAQLFPGLEYGFPRPPGWLAAQPWFQPACGAGRDAVDPAKDLESARYAANLAARGKTK